MTMIEARKNKTAIGRVRVPHNQNFSWTLRLYMSSEASVTVPIRTAILDRGWTQYFFADLDALAPSQISLLARSGVLELDRVAESAA